MTIQSYKLDDGTLTLGASTEDFETQVTNVVVTCAENVTADEDVFVLSGEELPGEENTTYDWTLSFNIIQDLAAAGSVAWSWTEKGNEHPFTFVPNTALARKVTGTVIVAPITVGGDVRSRPRSDASWRGKRGVDFILAAVV